MDLGAAIKAWRLLLDLSQEELADLAAISRQTVGRLETGRNQPSARTQALLAAAMGITVGQLHEGPPAPGGFAERPPAPYPREPSRSRRGGGGPRPIDLPYFERVPGAGWGEGLSRADGSWPVVHPRAHRGSSVVLRVGDDLMYPTLQEGDLVLVNTAARKPRSGDIIVISAPGLAAVTRYRRIRRRPHVAGDNPTRPPVALADLEGPVILGTVIALLRRDFR